MIGEHLDKPSLLSLSVTCWDLYYVYSPPSLELSAQDKADFLLRLERDNASLYFCHLCIALHPWHKRMLARFRPGCVERSSRSRLPCQTKHGIRINMMGDSFEIDYPVARALMNVHFYKDCRLVSIDKLCRENTSSHYSDRKIRRYIRHQARIIDDQLFFVSHLSLYDSEGNAKVLRRYLDKYAGGICLHNTFGADNKTLPELTKNRNPPCYFEACKLSMGSCSICMTDYCIVMTRNGLFPGWHIRVLVFRQLGSVRSPRDKIWSNMVSDTSTQKPRASEYNMHPPGIVCQRWHKADGEKADGEMVELQGRFRFVGYGSNRAPPRMR